MDPRRERAEPPPDPPGCSGDRRLHAQERSLRRHAAAGGLLLAAGLLALCAAAAHAEQPPCPVAISRDLPPRLYALLNRPTGQCRFEGVATHGELLEARWSAAGAPLPPITVTPRECAPRPGRVVGELVLEVPEALTARCPEIAPLLPALEAAVAAARAVAESASERSWLFRGTRALFLLIGLVTAGLLVRAARRAGSLWAPAAAGTWDRRWLGLAAGGFVAALALRLALPFSLGNWYAEVTPLAGPMPAMRFGPGYFAFQSLLRDLGVWGPGALRASQVVLGAAAVPLLVAVLRELRVSGVAAAASAVLLVVAPFHARLSATTSEHVLAATLCLALLLAWLRATRTGDWWWLLLAALLFPAVCATRVDMTLQAALVLAWPLLRDGARAGAPGALPDGESTGALGGRGLAWRVAVMGVVAAVSAGAAYALIAVPSRHPLPEAGAHWSALRHALPDLWRLAHDEPGWMSRPAVWLAAVGALAMALRRPWLLVRIAGTVLLAFAALGRIVGPDELVGARYFLFVLAILLIASGEGFAALLGVVPRRHRARVAPAALAALALWAGLGARRAYGTRYAFEDEYAFARQVLAALPAGCIVYHVPIRVQLFPRDLDCCLDPSRSPLGLDFPALRFRPLPDPTERALAGVDGCRAYYESIACVIVDDPTDPVVHARTDRAAAYLQQRCAEVHRVGRLEPIAETRVSPRATVDYFRGRPPRAAVYWWRP